MDFLSCHEGRLPEATEETGLCKVFFLCVSVCVWGVGGEGAVNGNFNKWKCQGNDGQMLG